VTRQSYSRNLSRRGFVKVVGGGLAAAAGAYLAPKWAGKVLDSPEVVRAAAGDPDLHLAGTDGWIFLPSTPAIPIFHPDTLAPSPLTTYIFGFRNVTGLSSDLVFAQKNKAQHSAPLFWVDEYVPALNNGFKVQLTNLGLATRPDLFDAHTVHWHGFRNVIPFFDGEPSGSVSVPPGRDFTYVFRPREPGTYMYHCHVEDIEHVQMGMTGMVFVRPHQNGNTALYPSGKYAYNDGDGSTGYDREYSMFLSEIWAEGHWDDAHIQLPDWSDYRADFALLNGRVYPDTIAPNGLGTDPLTGDLVPVPGYERLQYQPISSLVQCNAGERVLLRFANLGFSQGAMTLAGLKMHVVGRDATPMRGVDGTNTSYLTSTVAIGPGESFDAILTAPAYRGPGPYDTYLLYNRAFKRSDNLAAGGYGGQMTEIRVYPAGALGAQTAPNT